MENRFPWPWQLWHCWLMRPGPNIFCHETSDHWRKLVSSQQSPTRLKGSNDVWFVISFLFRPISLFSSPSPRAMLIVSTSRDQPPGQGGLSCSRGRRLLEKIVVALQWWRDVSVIRIPTTAGVGWGEELAELVEDKDRKRAFELFSMMFFTHGTFYFNSTVEYKDSIYFWISISLYHEFNDPSSSRCRIVSIFKHFKSWEMLLIMILRRQTIFYHQGSRLQSFSVSPNHCCVKWMQIKYF